MTINGNENIAVIANDIKWIKKTLNEMSTQLSGIPLALESQGRRIDSVENKVLAVVSDLMLMKKDLVLNTKFRTESKTVLSLTRWIIAALGLGNIFMFIKLYL